MPDWVPIAWGISFVVAFALGTAFGLRVRVQVHDMTNGNGAPISTEKPQQKKRNVRIPA